MPHPLPGAVSLEKKHIVAHGNRDGEVSRSEFDRMLKRMEVTLSVDEVDQLMDECDIDGGGTVSLSELVWRMRVAKLQDVIDEIQAHVHKDGLSLYTLFVQGDTNHDGVLSFDEFYALAQSVRLPLGRAKAQMVFNLFDADRSGVISYREFLQKFGYRAVDRAPKKEQLVLTGHWQDATLGVLKQKLLHLKTPAREFLAQYDTNDSGTLTMPNFRRVLWALGFEVNQTESDLHLYANSVG